MFKSQGRGVNLHVWVVTFQCFQAITLPGDICSAAVVQPRWYRLGQRSCTVFVAAASGRGHVAASALAEERQSRGLAPRACLCYPALLPSTAGDLG